MKRTFIYLIVLLLAMSAAGTQQGAKQARVVELTLYPAKVPDPAHRYQLLPKAQEQKDEDAAPLYAKAAQLLTKDFPADQINKWRAMPPDKLPIKQVGETLQTLRPSLQMVEQAAKCRECNWPAVNSGEPIANLQEYRRIAQALALQAGLLTAQGQYEQAIGTMGTGLTMARHIAESPSLVQGLVGVSIAAVICQQVEKFTQSRGAPNLYWALRGLPKPVVDLSRAIKVENANVQQRIQQYKDAAIRKQMEEELRPAVERCELLMNRLDRHVAALQCIEAVRHFAATQGGKFPNDLAAITAIALPADPVTGKPFIYRLTDATATLEGPTAKGGTEKDTIRYELKLNQ